MMTKTNEPSKMVAANGCIVPLSALKAKKPIVLTPAGKQLFNLWQAGETELVQLLDRGLMEQLRVLLVADCDAR
jgi:aromatic ring-opening dioxygenase LigB subunit